MNALDTWLTLQEPENVKFVAKMSNFGPLKKPLKPPMDLKRIKNRLNTCLYLVGTSVKNLNALDKWGTLKAPETAKYVAKMAKMINFGPLKSP